MKQKFEYKAEHFYLVLEMDLVAEQTDSGIILGSAEEMEMLQQGQTIGTIKSIGDTAFRHDRFGNVNPYKVGDKVCIKNYAGNDKRGGADKHGRPIGEHIRIVTDDEVLGKVGITEVTE